MKAATTTARQKNTSPPKASPIRPTRYLSLFLIGCSIIAPPAHGDNSTQTAARLTTAEQQNDTAAQTGTKPLQPDASGNVTVRGLLKVTSIRGKAEKTRFHLDSDTIGYSFGVSAYNSANIDLNEYANQYIEMTGKLFESQIDGKRSFKLRHISQIEDLGHEAILAYYESFKRPFDPSPNAKPFMGTWGPRVCLPSAMSPQRVADFDISHLANQIAKLDTASYVMVNVTQPAGGCYFTGPHPQLADALKLDRPSFPTRDVLGITLDAIQASGKKALVYFGASGLHANRTEKQTRASWDQYIESLGLNHVQATRELILAHYAKRYGPKIAGWWFDGSSHVDQEERILWRQAIHSHNPDAIIVFNRMAGAPYRSTEQCDYFGGHTLPIVFEPFWSMTNEKMITDIEAGPWMGIKDSWQVEEGYGALGHAFMGMQNKWTMGKCRFPSKQAIDWTCRVLKAGGMFTWSVPLNHSTPQIPDGQFKLLQSINRSVRELRANSVH